MSDDIRTVRVRSEVEDLRDKEAGKSFSYQMQLITKENRALPLKNAGSSGQRVLASIVIRLALAELFCRDCGLFALDEPTTHLDEKNAEALAQFLRNLAHFKREDKNFQLVVITHDQKFLATLGKMARSFYRVAKDERGVSRISLSRDEE